MKPLPNRVAETLKLYEQLERGELTLQAASKRMRRIIGKSQGDYARMVGISEQALKDFERGKSNPTLATLRAIGSPFGIDIFFRRRETN